MMTNRKSRLEEVAQLQQISEGMWVFVEGGMDVSLCV